MSTSKRILSAIFTTLPAIGFGVLIYFNHDSDYYWQIYDITITVFLTASLLIGFFLPPILEKFHITRPWVWIPIQGLLAFAIAGISMALVSVTPLCVGQGNGDGNNNLGLCLVTTGLVALFSSPVELIMLTVSTIVGGAILSETPLPSMKLNFRIIVLALITLTILCGVSIPLSGIVSAVASYQGTCHGFTDSVRDCTFWEFAQNEMDFMSILIFMPTAALAGAWVVTAITWGVNRLFTSERIRAAANWIGTGCLIILGLIFFPYVIFILGGVMLSSIFGRL